MIQEIDSYSQGTESMTLIEILKEDSESDKDLYLYSLNESLQIHKEMVERVQSEKDEAQETLEHVSRQHQFEMEQEQQEIFEQQEAQHQRRARLELEYDQLVQDLEQKTIEYCQMESKFQSHLKSARATEDDLTTLGNKMKSLLQRIQDVCSGVHSAEAWVVQVIVQEIWETPIQPGVVINRSFGKMYDWIKRRNLSWATRIRQQMTAFMARQSSGEEERAKVELIDKIQACLERHELGCSDVTEIVECALELNLAIKSQDALIDIMAIEKGSPFDPKLMISASSHQGPVDLVISPPILAREADHCFVLIPAKVLCA